MEVFDADGGAVRQARVHAAGMRLFVAEYGPPDGDALFLLHGLAAHGGVWRRVAPHLAARGVRVLAPDLPGHGLSDGKRHRGTYTPRFFARSLLALADAMGLERFHLAGNSLGGLVAARAALLAPERVQRLVLVDSAGLGRPGVPWRTRLMYLPFALSAVLGVSPSPLAVRLFLQRAVVADPAQAAELSDLLHRRPPLPVAVRRSALALLGPEGSVADELPRLALPTLLVWGDRDPQFPLALARAAVERMPRARLAVVAGAGHVPQWEAPEAVAALIGDEVAPAAAVPPPDPGGRADPPPRRLRPRRPIRRRT